MATNSNDVITGGVGADILTGLGGTDTFVFAAGGSTLTIGRTVAGVGTITGFDTITDFTAGATAASSEKIQFAGMDLAGNTGSSHGGVNAPVQRLGNGAAITAHSITNGIISFDDAGNNKFATAVALTSWNDVAAAVEYLQGTGFGAGKTVAFTAVIGFEQHTFVFIQGNGSGTNSQDVLIDLRSVGATSLSVDKTTSQLSVIDTTAPPPLAFTVDLGPVVDPTEFQNNAELSVTVSNLQASGAFVGDKITLTWGNASFERILTAGDFATNTVTLGVAKAAVGSGSYTVSVTLTDTAGNSSVATTTPVTVFTSAEPTITSLGGGATAAVSLAENSQIVGQLTASDPNGGALTYTLGGADSGRFEIVTSVVGGVTTRTLQFRDGMLPDFEGAADAGANNVYDLTLTVTNAANLTDTQAIAVVITNVAETPAGALATNLWYNETKTLLPVTTAGTGPGRLAVADNAGTEFAVASVTNDTVSITFFDERGLPNPVLPSAVLSDGVGTQVTDLQIVAGGTGLGYGVAWSETGAAGSRLKLSYYDGVVGASLGGEIAISANAGAVQHDLAISSYTQDNAAGRPAVDGFDVVWVEGAGGAHSTGAVYVQRFAVPLDARKDPSAPPAAAGLDGKIGIGSDAQVLVDASGRDPSVAGLIGGANETVVSWIDVNGNVNVRIYNDAGVAIGADLTALQGATALPAAAQQHVLALAGGGFVVAWQTAAGISGRVFTPGVAAGTFTNAGLAAIPLEAGSVSDFALTAMPDGGGFTLSWNALVGTQQAVFTKSYTAGGAPQEPADIASPSIFNPPTGAANAAFAGLVGDRYVVVYQDTTAGATSPVSAQIFDTRTLPNGAAITDGGIGLVINGDATKAGLPDVLVGTVGQDTIDGLAGDDIVDGAMGDDTIFAGAGNDAIDGGGGSDTLVLTGRFTVGGLSNDYRIASLGANMFQITDLRANGDGIDIVRSIESFQFLGNAVGSQFLSVADLIGGQADPITPTAWGWSDEDADSAPNADGTPDVDGFIVNPVTRTGTQSNVSVADSVGEFVAVAWENVATPGAQSHIRGQFFDVTLAPDAFIPNTLNLSDGVGIETNPVITSGGANSGWGVVFEQRDSLADTTRELRTNFVGPGQLTGPEISVLTEANVDQHDAAAFGSFLDRIGNPDGTTTVTLPTGMNDGYNVVWVSTHTDGVDGALAAGYGRIMLQRFEVPLDALGNPGAAQAGGIDGLAGINNTYGTGDAAVWVGNEDGIGTDGFLGRNPSISGLHTFETGIVWVAQDGAGGEKVMFRGLDDTGKVIAFPGQDNISAGFGVAAGSNAHIVSAGAVNFAIVWVTANAASPSGFSAMATMLSSAGNGLNGQGFAFGAPAAPFKIADLPAGFDPATGNFQVTGLSGEDSNDLAIAWNMTSAATGDDLYAQHIKVVLDPVTGIAISMQSEGDAIVVNAAQAGDQTGGALAGLLGDRFIAVYEDDNAAYTDGSDLVARVIDTRDAVNPDPIVGDLVTPAAKIQARRDVLIGTNGNDDIRGDILDTDGLVDFIFAGMGNDVVQGGPGLRGAAGIPEIIDGGEGNDTAVYTGRRQDYSITINGDGSIEVIDLRPVQDANGNPTAHDGIDNLFSIENLRFLDLANNGAGAETISFTTPGTPPPLDPSYNGTPVAWSIDDTSQYKEIAVDVDPTPGTLPGARGGIAATNLQDGAGLAWTVNGTQVWGITYDVPGKPDPVLLGQNTRLSNVNGVFSDNRVADIDVAMTGGLGMTAAWESTDVVGNDGGTTSIHLAFASTNTHVVLDPAGGVPGPGIPGGEIAVVGSTGAGRAIDPVLQGYEIVDANNDTLEVGFHVGFIKQNDGALDTLTGDQYGALMLARYEIPVYDILVDGAGLPILTPGGQGQLARDANGNLIPSTAATFGVGSETAPTSIGLDGVRGTADDAQAIKITTAGLLAANAALPPGATVIQGRSLSMGSLHDGQLVVSYVGTDEQVHLRIYLPSINETADRETAGGVNDVVALGVTRYAEFTPPFATTFGTLAPGQQAITVAQQNGSFGVFWGEAGVGGSIDIKGMIYAGAGSNWSPTPVMTFAKGLPAGVDFQVAPTGVTPGGLEDGFFVSWQSAGAGILGQRFDMAGTAVGDQIVVGDPTSGTPGAHSTAGIDDGRMIVAYEDGTSVSAQYLDNRQSGVTLIGPRTGAPADVIAGTVGDDAIDGRALNDDLYGGLGDDLITMGSGADIGHGGAGNDTLIGGTGQDQLLGEAGNDVLWGGLSGPIEPFDADLQAGLVAAGVNAALIATDPGVDVISGGAGNDTISFEGEFGRFNINLATGIVTSDRGLTGTFILEDVIGAMVDDGAGGQIFQFTNDVENATGGIGDDTLIGDAGGNVLIGGGGSDFFDGAGGADTVVLDGTIDSFTFARAGQVLTLTGAGGTQTIVNVEELQFTGKRVSVADIFAVLPTGSSASGASLAVADINVAPTAVADAATVAQGHTVVIKVLANDTDAAGQTLTVTHINGIALATGPVPIAGGVVALMENGALAFTAGAQAPAAVSFTYTVSDGTLSTAGAGNGAVSVTVTKFDNGVAPVSIVGTPLEHATLTAQLGVDPDGAGAGTPSYKWFSNGVAIAGATNATYVVATGDIGSTLSVEVTYTDAEGFVDVATSAPTLAVQAVDDGASTVTITGDATVGATLTSVVGADPDGAGTPVITTWLRNGNPIPGATGTTYVLTGDDLGATISVQINYTDAQGFVTQVTSASTGTVVTGGVTTLTGTVNADVLVGSGLDETINALAGDDTITGNGGSDVVNAGAGNDTILASVNDGNDQYFGEGDFDTYSLAATAAGAVVNLALGTSSSAETGVDTLLGIENVIGSSGADTITGDAGANTLDGSGGNDTLTGGAGADTFLITSGTDAITDLSGTGLAADVVKVSASAQLNATMTAAWTATSATTNAGTASINAAGNAVNLSAVTSGNGFTVTNSGAGTTITGSGLNDTLVGGAGNETLTGSAGDDLLTGNGGQDTFVVDLGTDTVTDLAGTTATTADILRVSAGASAVARLGAAWTATAATLNGGTASINANGFGLNLAAAAATLGNNGYTVTNTGAGAAITGSGLADSIAGGAGNDTLTGGAGNDALTGNGGQDTFVVDLGTDTVTDLAGTTATTADILRVSAGAIAVARLGAAWTATAATLNGGTASIDANGFALNLATAATVGSNGYTLTNSGSGASITGSGLADTITGGTGVDALFGGAGNDVLDGAGGDDALTGGAGADTFLITAGTDTVSDLSGTGAAADIIKVSAGALLNATMTGAWTATAATLNSGTASINANGFALSLAAAGGPNGYTVTNSGLGASLTGSAFADTITGGAAVDTLLGGGGNDVLDGAGGNDALTGGAGADTFRITAGSDTVTDLNGTGTAADSLIVSAGASVTATVTGAWTATATTSNAGTATINATGNAVNLSAVTTGSNGFIITTNGAGTALTGSGLNDTITGGNGSDTLTGGGGDDSINGGGGLGTDTAVFTGSLTGAGNVLNYLLDVNGAGAITVSDLTANRDGTDTVSNIEVVSFGGVTFTNGGTLLVGSGAVNNLTGGNASADVLVGGGGGDTLTGRGQNDVLFGNAGNDTLNGGGGKDFLIGGAGADSFVFNALADSSAAAPDVIWDFEVGVDKIDVRAIDAVPGGGDQAFTWIGNGNFGAVGQARFFVDANTNETVVQFNTDATFTTAEMEIRLHNAVALTATDLLL